MDALTDNLGFSVTGKICKTARLEAEWYEYVDDPPSFLAQLKEARLGIDLFSFVQRIPEQQPKYDYHREVDAIALLPIQTYEKWWKTQIKDKTRNMIRKAPKKGVELRFSPLDDRFVAGITEIYNECPIRQGKPFRHYGKDAQMVRAMNSAYSERSDFLGAYYNEELIGFAKLVNRGSSAALMQILSKISHRDKAPTNALIARAVERCAELGIGYLQYGEWSLGPLGEFKIHHGFSRFEMPRYYVALNAKGRLWLGLGWHRPLKDRIPPSTFKLLRKWRTKYYELRSALANLRSRLCQG